MQSHLRKSESSCFEAHLFLPSSLFFFFFCVCVFFFFFKALFIVIVLLRNCVTPFSFFRCFLFAYLVFFFFLASQSGLLFLLLLVLFCFVFLLRTFCFKNVCAFVFLLLLFACLFVLTPFFLFSLFVSSWRIQLALRSLKPTYSLPFFFFKALCSALSVSVSSLRLVVYISDFSYSFFFF